jgi:putative transposase
MATAIPSTRSGQVWEHTMSGDLDCERHVDYIHWNPVKHGLITRVADWPKWL